MPEVGLDVEVNLHCTGNLLDYFTLDPVNIEIKGVT